ncbi:hypothetical protein EB796_000445 [Bugula neritina]|uniref:Uncharacterized protein n=1 Tax=Bugula neritina TaxID=10212 RepID=A0A7J7KT52_BUGNE|nr:hypothetical protein EB796_000445 [Bugula neritina]
MAKPQLPNSVASTSYFRTRTASVTLKIDIHPPLGFNINHVEGESSHSTVIKQGEEILYYTVYSELKQLGLPIPKDSLLFQTLLCTSKGFLLLSFYLEIPCKCYEYFVQKCHCARRLRPKGCNGFLCLALAQLSASQPFSLKIAELLYHTVCACRWSVQNGEPRLLDMILEDSLSAMDTICTEHDLSCLGGWHCVMPRPNRKQSAIPSIYHHKHSLALVVTAAGILLSAFFIYKIGYGKIS